MKHVSMLVLTAGLVLAPVAHAQISCQQVQDLLEAATEDFDSVAGEEVSDSVYTASFMLEGASQCQVTFDLSSTYACVWVYDSLASARADYGRQAGALGGCLNGWERDAFDASAEDPKFQRLEGLSFLQEDDDGSQMTWAAYLEEHIDGDTHDWHLWLGVDDF
jgi:hypothetical protein